jgi:hypothetical protein
MDPLPTLTEAIIRQHASADSYQLDWFAEKLNAPVG